MLPFSRVFRRAFPVPLPKHVRKYASIRHLIFRLRSDVLMTTFDIREEKFRFAYL